MQVQFGLLENRKIRVQIGQHVIKPQPFSENVIVYTLFDNLLSFCLQQSPELDLHLQPLYDLNLK